MLSKKEIDKLEIGDAVSYDGADYMVIGKFEEGYVEGQKPNCRSLDGAGDRRQNTPIVGQLHIFCANLGQFFFQ